MTPLLADVSPFIQFKAGCIAIGGAVLIMYLVYIWGIRRRWWSKR